MATMKNYHISSPAGANLRDLPSTAEGRIVEHLPKGEPVQVCEDWTAENNVGNSTRYLAVRRGDCWLWCVDKLLTASVPHIDYLVAAGKAADKVFGMIYSSGVRHAGGANSYATIKEKKVTTCGVSASAVLQEAGCLPVGKVVSHTAAVKTDILKKKDTLDKAVKGAENLLDGTCTVVRVGKKFFDLPEAYKKAGTVYVQDSNICVSAGGGKIWSCNQTGKSYGKGKEEVLRSGGYPFTSPILYVIQPNP